MQLSVPNHKGSIEFQCAGSNAWTRSDLSLESTCVCTGKTRDRQLRHQPQTVKKIRLYELKNRVLKSPFSSGNYSGGQYMGWEIVYLLLAHLSPGRLRSPTRWKWTPIFQRFPTPRIGCWGIKWICMIGEAFAEITMDFKGLSDPG